MRNITYEQRGLVDWSLPAYRARVTYLPQSPAFVEGAVEANLQLVFDFDAHRDKAYGRNVILRHLARLGRSENFLERDVSVLSGGEQQIVALLRALQLHPQVLLLDEPRANVDADRTRQIETLLANWLDTQSGAAPVDACGTGVIMFIIAACMALATLGAVLLRFRVLFSARHRLRTDRLVEMGEGGLLA